jgi:hypothetical protein
MSIKASVTNAILLRIFLEKPEEELLYKEHTTDGLVFEWIHPFQYLQITFGDIKTIILSDDNITPFELFWKCYKKRWRLISEAYIKQTIKAHNSICASVQGTPYSELYKQRDFVFGFHNLESHSCFSYLKPAANTVYSHLANAKDWRCYNWLEKHHAIHLLAGGVWKEYSTVLSTARLTLFKGKKELTNAYLNEHPMIRLVEAILKDKFKKVKNDAIKTDKSTGQKDSL